MSVSPEELDRKIREARQKADQASQPRSKGTKVDGGAAAQALRVSIELVSAVVVGGLLGYFIDKWLGSAPWAMIIFFFLGFAAGFMNIYRSQTGQEFKIGFKKEED